MISRVKGLLPKSFILNLKKTRINHFYLISTELKFRRHAPRYFGQTAEDAIIRRYIPENYGTYVDVGAGRPIQGSNTYSLYKRGWSGVCIDPLSENARLFNIFRKKDQFISALVGSNADEIQFWEFDPYMFSTADKSTADRIMRTHGARLVKNSLLPIKPLAALTPKIDHNIPSFLSIDAEGKDFEVLTTNDWERFHPRVVCIEEWNLGITSDFENEVENYLNKLNYSRVAYTGLSSIFVDRNYLQAIRR